MIPYIARTVGLVAAVLVAAPPAPAQSPADIMSTMMERYRDQVEDIDNYRVTQTVMGFENTTTLEKTMVDGFPVFRSVSSTGQGEMEIESPYSLMPKLAERGTLEGTETVDGEETWALAFDVEGLDLGAMESGTGLDELDVKTLRFWVDTDDYLIRKMHMDGEIAEGGTARPIEMTALMTDYRRVDGMWHPFRMEMKARGLMEAAGGVSREELAETRAQLEQLKHQLESMPPAQREQMEKMMGPQLEQLETMVSSGEFQATIVVESLETNVDLSS